MRDLSASSSQTSVRRKIVPSDPLSPAQVLAEVFKLLADKARMKILLALAQDGELHVSALCELLGQSQPAVSHHLTLMRMTGLVGYRRDGKHNYYHLQSGVIRDLLDQCFGESGAGSK